MIQREEFEAMKADMEECKDNVHKKIADLGLGQKKLEAGHKKLEEAIHGQSAERKTFNDEIKSLFYKHTDDEMENIKKIFKELKILTEQTRENTSFISSTRHNEELEKRVAERLNAINKPKEEMWKKIKYTAISVITTAIIVGVGTAISFVFKMYMLIEGGGQ